MAYPSIERANQTMQQQAGAIMGCSPQPYAINTACPTQEGNTGIASALHMLSAEVDATYKLALSVRGALGINRPEQDGKELVQPSSLLDVLNGFRRKLISANQDFETVIDHINS